MFTFLVDVSLLRKPKRPDAVLDTPSSGLTTTERQKGSRIMATRAHSTPDARRPLSLAQHRAELHDIIEQALAMLDALDGDPDLEPETDEGEDDEATLQLATLAPDWFAPRTGRRPRREGGRA